MTPYDTFESGQAELLSEVDINDLVIGPRRRDELHRLGLRHRAVHVLVFNPAGEVFLQQRSDTKDINPGLWDSSAAGHVDHGEHYDACARRELAEELGIVRNDLELLLKLRASAVTGWEFIQVYRVVHDGGLLLNPDEIVGGQWLSVGAVDAWLAEGGAGLTGSFQHLWRACREFLREG